MQRSIIGWSIKDCQPKKLYYIMIKLCGKSEMEIRVQGEKGII